MTVRYLGGSSERRNRQFSGPVPTYTADFITGGGGSLPSGMTFSRGTTAQYYNRAGLLSTNENLALYSQTFQNAAWNTFQGTMLDNQGTAPDGTNTAAVATCSNTGLNNLWCQQTITLNPGVYVISMYARSDNAAGKNFGPWVWAQGTGTIVGGGNGSPTTWQQVSSTWTRFNNTVNVATGGTFALRFDASQGNAAVGDKIYVWGLQIQATPNVSVYNPTTSAAVYGPRFDYDPNPANLVQQNLFRGSFAIGNSNYWSGSGPTVYTQNADLAPDGSYTATTFKALAQYNSVGQNSTLGVPYVPGATYTFSGWVRLVSGTPSQFILQLYDGVTFFITNTVSTVTSQWQRFSITGTISSAATQLSASFQDNSASGFATYSIWGAQLNVGSTALPYLATTTAAQTICPPKGLLIEQSSTNLVTNSNDTTQAPWTQTSIASTLNNAISPDGSTNAIKLTAGALLSQHNVQQLTTAAIGTCTASVYLKYSNNQWIGVGIYDQGAAAWKVALFDVLNGVIGTSSVGTTNTITPVGNGWYRCVVTFTITAANPYIGVFIQPSNSLTLSWTAVGTEACWAYGAQVEALAFPTSYIPTTSAAVTRNADDTRITNFSPWFNQTNGTFSVAYDVGYFANTPSAFSVNPSGGFNAQGLAQWYNGTTNIGTSNSDSNVRTTRREAFAYTSSSRAICLNAGTVASDANVPFSGTVVAMFLGDAYNTGQWINGHIRSFNYYNSALSNTQLQALTT